VIPLVLPPLRERREDIPGLAQLFLERAASRHARPAPLLRGEALALLRAHPLPGNVRQLQHVMEAALLLTTGADIEPATLRDLLTPSDAPYAAAEDSASSPFEASTQLTTWLGGEALPPISEVRREVERVYLIEVLRRARGNVTAAAKIAGRHRTDFYDLLRRHNLTTEAFR
jgi:two-component system response regulator GlrR